MNYITTNGTTPPDFLEDHSPRPQTDPLSPAETETALIGGMLAMPVECWPQVERAGLNSGAFSDPTARIIFNACRETARQYPGNWDAANVAQTLTSSGDLERIGGWGRLEAYMERAPYQFALESKIEAIREADLLRRAREQCRNTILTLQNPDLSVEERLEHASNPPDWQAVAGIDDELEVIDSGQLDSMELKVEWLIDQLLPAARPGILAGPSKGCKTTLAVSAGVAVAAGVPWCGRATTQGNVLVVSCESGAGAIQATARRVCRANGLRFGDLKNRLAWRFDPLDLTSPRTIRKITKYIERHKARLVILDPAYILLAGLADQVNNQMAMGEALQPLGKMAADTGASIMLAAHYVKSVATSQAYSLPELSSIAHAGLAQWMRYWWLVNRRAAYDPENLGFHELWLVCGGSDGQATSWGVDLQEGHDGSGWRLDVQPASSAMAQREENREEEKLERQQTKAETRRQLTEERNNRKVLSFLTTHARTFLNVSKISRGAGQSNGTTSATLDRLVDAGTVVCRENERSGKPEYLLKASLEEVSRAEAEAKSATQRDNTTGRDKTPLIPPDGPVPSGDGHDNRQDERDSPDSPDCPVSPEKRRPKQKTTKARKQTTATTATIVEATSVSATSTAADIEISDDRPLETGDISTTTQQEGQ